MPGCGSSNGDPSAAASKASSSSSSSTSPATSPGRSRHETRGDILAAIASCKQGVDTGSWLPKESRTPLYAICENGLRRGLTEIRAYALETCSEVAYTSPAKTEAEKARVFATCYEPTKQKTAKIE